MTTGCGILFLIDEDVIAEAKWIRSNSEIAIPPKRVQSQPKITKSRRCRYLTLYPCSQEKAIYYKILEN